MEFLLGTDRSREFGPLPQMEAWHLILLPKQIGACSLHEFRRKPALKGESDPTPQSEGLMAVLPLMALRARTIWRNGRKIAVGPSLADQFRFFDLRDSFVAEVPFAFHTVNLIMPNTSFVERAGGAPKWNWKENGSYDDPVLSHLLRALIPAIRNPDVKDIFFGDLILQAASRHIGQRYGDLPPSQESFSRALSKREESRAKDVLEDRIGGDVTLEEVASACRVPTDNFVSMFEWATGMPPHRWLVLQRIDRAKSKLLNSDDSPTEIAAACGFDGEGEFMRVFALETGMSPEQWRGHRKA
jgi:AraC family transcriptional regulator